jgi:hypothetical protein
MADLWLPSSYRGRHAGGHRRGYLSYICWSDVSETPMCFEDIRRLLAEMRTESMLKILSALELLLANQSWQMEALWATHQNLAHEICDAEIADRVARLIGPDGRDVLVHDEQLLLTIKLAIIHGQPGEAEGIPEGILGKVLLGINDLLGQAEMETRSPQETLTTIALRQRAISRNEQLRYLVARYYDLLVTRTGHITNPQFNFEQKLRDDLGIGIEEYFALAFMHLAPFYGLTDVAQLAWGNISDVIRQYYSQLSDPQVRTLCQRLFSTEIAEIRLQLEQDEHTVRGWSLLPLKRTPFFRIANGSALPFFLPFVYESVAVGVYWRLLDLYSKLDGRRGVQTFAGHIGPLFQGHITDLLIRAHQQVAVNEAAFFSEQQIIDASPVHSDAPYPPFDGALISENTLVIFEMGILTLTQTAMEQADPARFAQDVKRDFLRKVRDQLNPAIDQINAGLWNVPGLKRETIRHIIPVLVLLHPFPQNMATLQPLFDAGKPRGPIAFGSNVLTATVYEPQILTAEDLEMLEPLIISGDIRLAQVLLHKLQHPEGITMSMKDYLFIHLHLSEIPNEYMRTRFLELAEHLGHALERFTTG